MAELVQIGDSKGVRIPKALIEEAGLENRELELQVVPGGLLIKPAKQPRQGWTEAIERAIARGEIRYDQEWLEADLDSELESFPNT